MSRPSSASVRNELNREEWIARRLLVDQFRQRRGALRFAVKGIRQQLRPDRRARAGVSTMSCTAAPAWRIASSLRISGCVALTSLSRYAPISSRCCRSGSGQQIFEQIERRRIQPLQIVEEERQRMLRAREDADEPPEHQLETSLRLLRRKLGDRRLLADDELQFRDEIDDQLPIRAQRLPKRVAPFAQVCVVLAEERPDQALEGLRQRGIRDVALVLVELAGCKQAARRDERLVELVDDRGLADAGVAGDQHQLRPAARDDAIEGGEQGVDLARPARTASRGSAAGPECRASPSVKSSMRPWASHCDRQRRRSLSTPAAV